MQLISQGLPLAAASAISIHPRFAEFLQREEVRHLATLVLIAAIAGQIIWILSLWVASKMMVDRDESTMGNAVKVWVFGLVAWIVVIVGMSIGVPVVLKIGEAWRVILVLGGGLMLAFLFVLLIPMKVYGIGFFRALVLLIIAGCLNSVVLGPIEFALFRSQGMEKDVATLTASIGKTPEEQRKFGERLVGQEAADEIDRMLDDALQPIGPRPPLSDREATVRTLQQKLTAKQHALKPADSRGQAAYQAQIKRYLMLRDQVAAEQRGQPVSAVH